MQTIPTSFKPVLISNSVTKKLRSFLFYNNWKKLPKCDVLLVGSENHYTLNYQGFFYSPLLDSYRRLLISKHQSAEILLKPYSTIPYRKLHNRIYFFSRKYALCGLIKKSPFPKNLKEKEITAIKVNFWLNVIKKTNPIKIIGIQPDRYLCEAAKKANVAIADLQHGVIDEGHLWYGEKFNCGKLKLWFPNEFLVWDKSSGNALKWSHEKNCKVTVIGHPWIERFIANDPEDNIVQYYLNQASELKNKNPNILLTLQAGVERYFEEDPNFDGYMHSEIKKTILSTQYKYNWLIRLHPGHIHGKESIKISRYLSQFDGYTNIIYRKSTNLPLPAILNFTDIHITHSSTVVKESAWFGVKSVITDSSMLSGGERDTFFAHERRKGIAEVLDIEHHSLPAKIDSILTEAKSQKDA